MRKKYSIVLLVICLSLLIGCASTNWKEQVTTGYEAVGVGLTTVRDSAKSGCANGVFTVAECAKIKDAYIKAQLVYINAWNALILSMNVQDSVIQKKLIEDYQKYINDFAVMLPDLLNLISSFKGDK